MSCRYRAEVSGGKDYGFFAGTDTMICNKRNKLVDVVVEFVGDYNEEDLDKIELNRCPNCKGKSLCKLEGGMICSKCRIEMEMEQLILIWD